MREYIFRGKRVDNGEWAEGSLLIDPDLEKYFICGFDYYTADYALQREEFMYEVIPESVGQYTGMNDKNDRKTFEGDIVRLDEYVKSAFDVNDGVVKYGWGGFYIGAFSTLNSLNALAAFDGVLRGEVIGNVFENADLLEG